MCAGFWDDDSDEAYEGALSRAVTVEDVEVWNEDARFELTNHSVR
jgi:hypothetical protein